MYTFLIVLLLVLPLPLYWVFKALFKNKKPISTGLDHKNNALVLVGDNTNNLLENDALLKKILYCRLNKITDPLTACTLKVVLEINFHTDHPAAQLIFYDAAKDPVHELPFRVRKATYWKTKIQLQLNSTKAEPILEYVL